MNNKDYFKDWILKILSKEPVLFCMVNITDIIHLL